MPIHAMIEQEKGADGARAATRVHMRLETSGSLGGRQGSTVLIHNLSATGMLIETASDLDIGQRIAVSLPEAPDCTATIVWRSEALAGCRFDLPLSRAASADPSLTAKRLHALIETSRDEIALLAGVDPDKVRITIEY